MMHQYTDSLNTAYVAFTRARNEMYCFAPLMKSEGNEINNLSDLMLYSFSRNESLKQYYNAQTKILEIGESSEVFYEEKKKLFLNFTFNIKVFAS